MPERRFEGFDHVDCRVVSIAAVEPFYDALMPELGLPNKHLAYVDEHGEWHQPASRDHYNAVEYHEPPHAGRAAFFIGFIEQPDCRPSATRIAFRLDLPRLEEVAAALVAIGARNVERSADFDAYPAVFFEDPAGTKLELAARRPPAG